MLIFRSFFYSFFIFFLSIDKSKLKTLSKNKKAETIASTFDMMLMIIENRIKESEIELSETHNLVES